MRAIKTEREIGDIPWGWFVLWNPDTLASLMWTKEIQQQYIFPEEWFEMLNWAAKEAMNGT